LFLRTVRGVRVDADEARRLIAHGALLVDVRRHDDTAAPLDGALRIPPDEIPQNLVRLRRGTTILLTCT